MRARRAGRTSSADAPVSGNPGDNSYCRSRGSRRLPDVEMRTVTLDHPDARRLITELQQEYVRRYGGGDATPIEVSEFVTPRGMFIVGYLDGIAMACGGW